MPEQIAQLLGLGTPFAAACAAYLLFLFLDKKASDDAKKALVAWMKGLSYKKLDLAAAVTEGFDHIYGAPLFRLKAFMVSIMWSLISANLYWLYKFGLLRYLPAMIHGDSRPFLLTMIVSDYISLFVVRRSLKIANVNIYLTMLLATIAAMVTLLFCTETFSLLGLLFGAPKLSFGLLISMLRFDFSGAGLAFAYSASAVFVAALFIYVWLPLFFIGAATNIGLNAFFRTTAFFQWFLTRGDQSI